MRNIDELVKKSDWRKISPDTFEGQREYYEALLVEIDDIEKEIELLKSGKSVSVKMHDTITVRTDSAIISKIDGNNIEILPDDKTMSFEDRLNLYNLLCQLNNQHGYMYAGVDLVSLREKFKSTFSNLEQYLDLMEDLRNAQNVRDEILNRNIDFDEFSKEEVWNSNCFKKHHFAYIDKHLECLCCGASTKGFEMNDEQIQFLMKCAKSQGMLLETVTKSDIPLYRVLKAEEDAWRNQRTPLNEIEKDSMMDRMDWAEEYFLQDESELSDIDRTIRRAQMWDSGIYETDELKVSRQTYFDQEWADYLNSKVANQFRHINNSYKGNNKELLLEMCLTYIYEIEILSGKHIPSLYASATTEEDKIAIVKAYSNLSNQNYRVQSGYFKHDNRNWDAVSYDCRTAHPKINEKIMEMKLKR